MRKRFIKVIILLMISALITTSCTSPKNNETIDSNFEKDMEKEYFTLEDFDYLVMGQSTLRDLPYYNNGIIMTSFGARCEYPTESDGETICVDMKYDPDNNEFVIFDIGVSKKN